MPKLSLLRDLAYSEGTPPERIEATLTSIGEPAIKTFLDDLVSDDATRLKTAMAALGKIGPTARVAVGRLLPHLASNDRALRFAAAEAICLIDKTSSAPLPVLQEMYAVQDELALRQFVPLLGKIAPADESGWAQRKLLASLEDSSVNVRLAAAHALADAGNEATAVLPALENLLADEHRQVQNDVALLITRLLGKADAPK